MRTFGSLSASASVLKRLTEQEVESYLQSLSGADPSGAVSVILEAGVFL